MSVRTITTTTVLLVAVAAGGLSPADGSLVRNGDFAAGAAGWNDVASDKDKEVAVVDDARHGKVLLLKRKTEGARTVAYQSNIRLKPLTLYRLSATGWGDTPAAVKLHPASSKDAAFSDLTKSWATSAAPFEKSAEPTTMTFVYDSGLKADSAILSVYLTGKSPGEARVKDLSLVEVGPSNPDRDETVIAHLGDSITITSYLPFDQRVDRVLQAMIEKRLPNMKTRQLNLGVDGEWLGALLDTGRYAKAVKENYPKIDVVFIRYGGNDTRKYDITEFKKQLGTLSDNLKRDYPGVTIIIGTGPYGHGLDWGNTRQYGPYWQAAREFAKERNYPLVDIYARFEKEASFDTARQPKDLHPSALGVRLIAEEEFEVLKTVLAPAREIPVSAALEETANPAEAKPDTATYKAGDVPTYAELDKGEKISFQLHDGTVHIIELVSYTSTTAEILIDGEKHEVRYRAQDLPREVAGMRLAVDITKAWSDTMRFSWFGLRKDCRLFLSDASRPVMCNPEGAYPLSPAARIDRGTLWGGGWLAERREARKDCHIGYDIYGAVGTKLLAIEDVVVADVWVDREYGDMLVVDLEGERFGYRCLHMMEAFVKKGQKLKRGDEVGLIGQTGYIAYPHLHLHMMLPRAGEEAGRTDDAGAVRTYFAMAETRVHVNPAPYIHDMYERLDPKCLVEYHKVTLKAVDPEGNPVQWPHYRVRTPDGRTYDVGVHDSTSVPVGVNPFTFIASKKRLGLRGEKTVTIAKSGDEVVIEMQPEPETEKPPEKPAK